MYFDREKVAERQPHAKGSGAFDTFHTTEDVSTYTKAALFQKGAVTEHAGAVLHGGRRSWEPDIWRDVRGFSLKFYTDEGNCDLVGNNTPIFIIRDTMKFPHFIRSQKRLSDCCLRDNHIQWNFWTNNPESTHQVTYLMGERGMPRTWRNMNGLRLAHLSVDQRGRREVLGQVPFPYRPGHRALHQRRSCNDVGQ